MKNTNIVFNVPLVELVAREKEAAQTPPGIPKVVMFLVDHLKKSGMCNSP
jgi:primosomal replication protein N